MIRVLVAEDSVTVRELLVGILESDPDIRVVGQAKTGAEAVELASRLKPDLITMDVHMPVVDGLEATKEIMVRSPAPILIVSSSASRREQELSLSALRAGALMVIAKPDNPTSERFAPRQAELLAMVKALSQVKVVRRWGPRPAPAPAPARRRALPTRSRLVAVAASTGGPVVLQRILADLPGDFPTPILVVQHIAAGFVAGLAEWLTVSSDLHVKVAEDGEALLARTAYLAPDDRHLGVDAGLRAVVSDEPPVGGFRPSATYLFESAARACGTAVTALILTGMGSDGVEGLKAVRAAGGQVLAQDEASSVVFGMPGEAVKAGIVDAVLAVEAIARELIQLVQGRSDADADSRR